jgi:hypothetical protein
MIRQTTDDKALSRADDVSEIMKAAVERAQDESRRLGVPNVYSIEGVLWYELPNGKLSRDDPYQPSSVT